MPNIPQIVSQPNLLRNGDFSHFVASTTTTSPPGTEVFQSLLAHWKQIGVSSAGVSLIAVPTVVKDDPHRFIRLLPGESIEQDILDHSFFRKPSEREFDGTVTGVAAGVLTISTGAVTAFEVNEPSPAPLAAPTAVRTQPGDEIQLVNFTNPASSGKYRVVAYNSPTSIDVVAVSPTDSSTATAADVIRILRKLSVFIIDLTVVFSVPVGQAASSIEPSLIVRRELPMGNVTVLPLSSLVVGAPTAYDDVTLSPGAVAKQIVCRLTNAEFIRSPRDLSIRLSNTVAGPVDVADVGLYIGNYHLPVSTVSPAPRGSVATPLIPGPDHLHLLTGKGDLILMRAGSQAPAGYRKLKEELAFQFVTAVSAVYDAGSDTTQFSVPGWSVPADELSGTYEIVFTDPSPAAPARPGPLDVSVRMSDILFSLIGGAEIDLAGLLAGETVTFDVGGVAGYGPITLTEGVDFTDAATLASAINAHATLGPLMTASFSGTVVQVIDDSGYTSDATLLTALGTLADTVTGSSWQELNGGSATTQFKTIKSAVFTTNGDLGARNGDSAYIIATAPILVAPVSSAGIFRKPTKAGDGAVEVSSTVLEIDVDGVSVQDILTFVDDDGDPLPPAAGPQGPTYRITAVDLAEGQVTVVDVTGGTTNVGAYTTDPANRYVIEKASGNHTHYAQQSNIEDRELDAGGSNSNVARGQHGHQMYADDAIPPYRKFIICEKL